MSIHYSEIDLIEQYLAGMLDEEKRAMMDKKISSDSNYANKINQYKLLFDGVKYSGKKSLLAKMNTWDLDISNETNKKEIVKNIGPVKWYYAAAVIVFFIVASFFIISNLNSGYSQLVATYYQPFNFVSETKRSSTTNENFLNDILNNYDQGNYVRVIQVISKLEQDQKTAQVNYMLANAYQATNKYSEAINLYKNIISSNSIYTSGAKWYLALCYLSLEDINASKPLLEELNNSNSSYSQKADSVLKELD